MNTNEQTEPTPRTDAVDAEIAKIIASNQSAEVSDLIAIAIGRLMRHTRKLERELNAATRRAEKAEKELSSANEALKLAAEALNSSHSRNCNTYSECDWDLGCNCGHDKWIDEALSAIQAILGKEGDTNK